MLSKNKENRLTKNMLPISSVKSTPTSKYLPNNWSNKNVNEENLEASMANFEKIANEYSIQKINKSYRQVFFNLFTSDHEY